MIYANILLIIFQLFLWYQIRLFSCDLRNFFYLLITLSFYELSFNIEQINSVFEGIIIFFHVLICFIIIIKLYAEKHIKIIS